MKRIIPTLLSVGAVAYLLYVFTFFMDGEMGMILLAFLVIAPLTSLIFALYGAKRIKVSFICDAYVKKGSDLTVRVTVEKSGVFPLAVVEIRPTASEVFEEINTTYRLSAASPEKKEFTFRVRAKTGGNGSISVGTVYSCGFLGFIHIKVKHSLPQPASVGVIPDIPDIKASSQLFRSIADVVFTGDEEETNDTAMLFSANTSPGYEHREYVPGDSMKRVNWKLSSKRNKLMVRLDEAAAAVQPVLILDLYRKKGADARFATITEEKLLRSVFGLLTLLLKQGIACNFIYRNNDELVSESVDNPDYPMQLLLKVLAVRVEEDRRAGAPKSSGGICSCIIATTDAGEGLAEITSAIQEKENISILGISAESINKTGLPLWYLDDDNNFRQV